MSTTVRATAGTADITPVRPLALAGFATRAGAWSSISDALEINGLLLEHEDERLLVLTFDLLYVGPQLRRRVIDGLCGALRPEQVLLCASHTHFAPATDPNKPRLGAVDRGYVDDVSGAAVTLAHRLLGASPEPVTLTYHRGNADHAIHRRIRRLTRTQMGPNPRGVWDETIHVVRVARPDGPDLAHLWSYACHPVGFPDRFAVSADYPGVVRARLRRDRAALPVLFCQGFAGDVRPRVIARPTTLLERARRLVTGPRFGALTPEGWSRWSASLAACVLDAAARPPVSIPGPLVTRAREVPLAAVVPDAAGDRRVTWQLARLGPDVALVGVSAEPASVLGRALPAGCIPVGYIDDVFGYLVDERARREGGYEVSGFLPHFGLRAPVAANAAALHHDHVAQLLR